MKLLPKIIASLILTTGIGATAIEIPKFYREAHKSMVIETLGSFTDLSNKLYEMNISFYSRDSNYTFSLLPLDIGMDAEALHRDGWWRFYRGEYGKVREEVGKARTKIAKYEKTVSELEETTRN